MYASAEIQGREVIGLPGQNLTQHELLVLVGIAEGIPSQVIAERMDAEPIALRQVEAAIQAKLGAKNKAHMITRGFTLGVLVPNALCILLCLATVLEADHSFTRPRSQRRQRNGGSEITRLVRTSPSSAGQGRAVLFV